MKYSMPNSPVLHYLLEFAQIHVHWIGDANSSSHPLPPPSPFAFTLSQHQGLFQGYYINHIKLVRDSSSNWEESKVAYMDLGTVKFKYSN